MERLRPSAEAVWLVGSAAMDDYTPGRSDVDLMVVARECPPREELLATARRMSHSSLPCPARKLELVLYPRAEVERPSRRPHFCLNLNTGEGMEDHVGLEPDREPGFWFLLDLAMARERGRSLHGPPPAEVIGAIQRADVLDALRESLDWHRREQPGDPDNVLNALRTWRWLEEGTWSSKGEAAQWMLGRLSTRLDEELGR